MSSLSERLTRGAASSPSQVDHARRLVADWQLLADLAFADLTLWVPLPTGAWWCVAQVRPLTAPTSRPEDMVGAELQDGDADQFGVAFREGRPGGGRGAGRPVPGSDGRREPDGDDLPARAAAAAAGGAAGSPGARLRRH